MGRWQKRQEAQKRVGRRVSLHCPALFSALEHPESPRASSNESIQLASLDVVE